MRNDKTLETLNTCKNLDTCDKTSAVSKSLDNVSLDSVLCSDKSLEYSKDSIQRLDKRESSVTSETQEILETQDTCKHSKINHFKVTCICKNNLYIKPCKKQKSKINIYSQEFVKNPFITCNKCFYNHDLDKFFVNFHYKATKYNSKMLRVLYNDIQEHLSRDSKEIAIKLKENLDFIQKQTQHIT